jgi:deoxyadenosine/deoxycytidine kinase
MRIAVDGNIGSGKTTVLHALRRHFGSSGHADGNDAVVLEEPVDEWTQPLPDRGDQTLLDRVYADPAEWGLHFSLRVLLSFGRTADVDASKTVITERCPLSCRHVFTQLLFNDGHLSHAQWDAFKDCADVLGWLPDAIVFVDTPAHVCAERIKRRGRPCEASLDVQYLRRLEFQYDTMLKYVTVPVVRLDGTADADTLAAAAEDAVRALVAPTLSSQRV